MAASCPFSAWSGSPPLSRQNQANLLRRRLPRCRLLLCRRCGRRLRRLLDGSIETAIAQVQQIATDEHVELRQLVAILLQLAPLAGGGARAKPLPDGVDQGDAQPHAALVHERNLFVARRRLAQVLLE